LFIEVAVETSKLATSLAISVLTEHITSRL